MDGQDRCRLPIVISKNLQEILIQNSIFKVAVVNSTVLVRGETGTGKELVAKSLHQFSPRADGPLISVNCAAIPDSLIEAELFGHAKGAFTGATNAREGLFSFANDGTLFLDEISEMPLHMQSQLLRVLEEKSVRAVGSDQETPINVRVIAATNRHLAKEVEEGRFRHDLYYRLEVVTLRVPPLRNRIDDIPQLSEHFLLELSHSLQTQPMVLTYEEISELKSYSWPGNVRELKNVLERYMLLGKFPYQTLSNSADMASSESKKSGFPVSWDIETVERHHVANVLNATGANKSEAARTLGISRKTLDRKLSKWKSNAVKP